MYWNKTTQINFYISRDQKFEINFPGLKAEVSRRVHFFSEGSWGESVSLTFPAFRGHLHFLAHFVFLIWQDSTLIPCCFPQQKLGSVVLANKFPGGDIHESYFNFPWKSCFHFPWNLVPLVYDQ